MTMPRVAQAGAPRLVYISNLIREHLPPKYWDREADWFAEGVEYNPLDVSAVATPQTFTAENDSDFLIFGMSAIETTAVAGTTEQTFWPVLIRILDSGSGASWFGPLMQLHNVVGRGSVDGQGFRPLKYPRFVVGGSTVRVEATNLEATARRLWITFHGVKIFRRPRV